MLEKPTSLVNILRHTEDQLRPVTSPCFDLKDKRAQAASLKDRIRINTELTKSVKLTQRRPGDFYRHPPIISSNDYGSPHTQSNQFVTLQPSKMKNINGDLSHQLLGPHAASAQSIDQGRRHPMPRLAQ